MGGYVEGGLSNFLQEKPVDTLPFQKNIVYLQPIKTQTINDERNR